MKIEPRPYYCPLCDHRANRSTNHIGEIYSGCKNCGHAVLYCDLPEAREALAQQPCKAAYLRCYYLNRESPIEAVMYRALGGCLAESAKTVSKLIPGRGFTTNEDKAISDKKNLLVECFQSEELEKHGQYVTNIGRLHDWVEWVYPNPRIKSGYWLEFVK